MKRLTLNQNRWEDHYSRKAKDEHFPARSVYKLQEIQNKHHLIEKGDKVLDLGCSPGSWLLFAANLVGDNGQVVGIDIKPVSIKIPPFVRVYTDDMLAAENEFSVSVLIEENFNVVLSDMAPATTGNKSVDAARSLNLCETALSTAQKVLIPGGYFVCKIFQGEDFKLFSDSVRSCFKKHKIYKPKSSRKKSKEIYIIGLGKK